jgi:hypothetical protein
LTVRKGAHLNLLLFMASFREHIAATVLNAYRLAAWLEMVTPLIL